MRVIRNGLPKMVVGGVAVLAAFAVATPAQAVPAGNGPTSIDNGVTVDSDGQIHYDVDLSKIPGAEITTEHGVRTEHGSCSFHADGHGMAGDPSVLIVTELAFDPNTCTRKLARAEYDRDAVPASVREKLTEQPATIDTESSTDSDIGIQASWSGSLKVNVEDPPQIDVTTTESELSWNSSGGASQNSHWGWFSGSGWGRESHDHNHYDGVTYGSIDTTAHYRNGVFCATIDAHTYHDQTYFRGHFDGEWYWSYEVDKSGGCTGLLHYEYIADTP